MRGSAMIQVTLTETAANKVKELIQRSDPETGQALGSLEDIFTADGGRNPRSSDQGRRIERRHQQDLALGLVRRPPEGSNSPIVCSKKWRRSSARRQVP